MMKTRYWATLAVVAGMLASGVGGARGQNPASPQREAIEAEFQKDLVKLEQTKIARLGELAASQPKAEAATTYNELFRFTIAIGQYEAAEKFAEAVIKTSDALPETRMLAEMVNLVAQANRGAYDESLQSLAQAIRLKQNDDEASKAVLPLEARFSLLNAYTQRLVHDRRYTVATQALTMIRDAAKDPALKNLASSRLALLEMIGKPAPVVAGVDLDGKPIKSADYKDKIVLVLFWASWCVPNHQEAEEFRRIAAAYHDKGLRIIGVNLDAMQDGGVPVATVLPAVRRFVVENNLTWPTVMNTPGASDIAKAFGVTEIPSDVLIGRDGKVMHIDLTPASLEKMLAALPAK